MRVESSRTFNRVKQIGVLVAAQVLGSLIGTWVVKKINYNINIFLNKEIFFQYFCSEILPCLIVSLPVSIIIVMLILKKSKDNSWINGRNFRMWVKILSRSATVIAVRLKSGIHSLSTDAIQRRVNLNIKVLQQILELPS